MFKQVHDRYLGSFNPILEKTEWVNVHTKYHYFFMKLFRFYKNQVGWSGAFLTVCNVDQKVRKEKFSWDGELMTFLSKNLEENFSLIRNVRNAPDQFTYICMGYKL